MTQDPTDPSTGPDDPNRPAPTTRPPRAGQRLSGAAPRPTEPPPPPPPPEALSQRHYGESDDPTAPPSRMSFKGARATAALIILLSLIEISIYLFGRVLGLAEGFAGPNALREAILQVFAFVPGQLFAVAQGVVGPVALLPLLSHAFLHGGLVHLAFNMAAMAALGPPVERRMSTGAYLLLFVLCGIAGALGHTLWQYGAFLAGAPGGERVLFTGLVGASGAICGLLGFDLRRRYEALRLLPEHAGRIAPGRWLWNASAGFVLVNVGLSLIDSVISGAAHLGGFAAGLLLAPLLMRKR
ncbi:MAG: rhomboid family intramembrane serine protease [Pseudomonadota bacterium]